MEQKKVTVIKELCPKNHACPAVKACPVNALVQNGYAPEINFEICIGWGRCVNVCPKGALTMKGEETK